MPESKGLGVKKAKKGVQTCINRTWISPQPSVNPRTHCKKFAPGDKELKPVQRRGTMRKAGNHQGSSDDGQAAEARVVPQSVHVLNSQFHLDHLKGGSAGHLGLLQHTGSSRVSCWASQGWYCIMWRLRSFEERFAWVPSVGAIICEVEKQGYSQSLSAPVFGYIGPPDTWLFSELFVSPYPGQNLFIFTYLSWNVFRYSISE